MVSDDLDFASAITLADWIRTKRVSPVEVTTAILARIEQINPALNAYCLVLTESALAEARRVEAAVMAGDPLGPLAGVPVSIKDIVITKGVKTTFGSWMTADYVPEEDAPVVQRLREAGAIILGKTTTPELGWKGDTASPLLGVTRNPWDRTKSPGGSSGGAAAAVAAGLGPLAVGTDGGGSIRIPGSFCGVVGLKPTYGVVPVYPAPTTGTLSHAGPMARTVRDAALMLDVIAGADDRDPLSFPRTGETFSAGLERGIRGLRIAWSPTFGYAQVDPEVLRITEAGAQRCAALGATVETVLDLFADPDPIWAPLFYTPIAARILPRIAEWGDRIDPDLVAVAQQYAAFTAVKFQEAVAARAAFTEKVRRLFTRFDLLLSPTLPVPPFAAGAERPPAPPPGSRLAWVAFTYPFNLTGQPAATIPAGWTAAGLPVGLQIVGRRLEDVRVLRAALEAAAPWAQRRPML